MLPSLIRQINTSESLEPEDIFTFSLGLIFTDELQNQHGSDSSALLGYRSRKLAKELKFKVADPNTEEERTKFAHYLWNAGVLMGELVAGRPSEQELAEWEDSMGRDTEMLQRTGYDKDARTRWWTNEAEEKKWSVAGERVLELGAGVGLAGMISVLAGAEEVVISDYPAPDILSTIKTNVKANIPNATNVRVEGHQWAVFETPFAMENKGRFSRVIAADCLWMPWEQANLAKSILHFLDLDPKSRAYVIAGFHTGRAKLAPFFEEIVQSEGLAIEEIYEMDADGRRREWLAERDGGREHHGERKKWLVVARLKRQ